MSSLLDQFWALTYEGETFAEIWDQCLSPPVYNRVYELWPGFLFILLITLIHILMNRITEESALTYAEEYVSKVPTSKNTVLEHAAKFQEAMFKVIVFACFIYIVGLYVMFTEDFYWNPIVMWNNGIPQLMNIKLEFYYALQLGYHGHRALYQFYEFNRSTTEFIAMFIHHWITVSLIICSWMVGVTQIGASVLLTLDHTDVFLTSAKLLHYLGFDKLKIIFMLIFMVLWFIFRVGFYPYQILWSLIRPDGGWPHTKINQGIFWCWVGLVIIYILNLHWTIQVVQTIIAMIRKGKALDIRSDNEPDKDKSKKE